MRLTFDWFDARRLNFKDIIDQDTGETIGHIRSNGTGFDHIGGIDISMFDDKYRITVNRCDECWAFIKGVETVLNHMTATGNRTKQATQSTAA